MNIPFAPPYITEDEVTAATDVLKSGWLSVGCKTEEFENRFAEYIGSKRAVATNSCTAALFLSLKVLDIEEGDEVITTPLTFGATANVIVHCGAKPIFADIDEKTCNIDPGKLAEKITGKTKAIIVVHYGGQPANMKRIMSIAKEHDLKVVEDAAHATGSEYPGGRKVGSLGNLSCFSFYPTKPITTGEGGMITLNDDRLDEELRILRLHGMSVNAWKRYLQNDNWHYEITRAGYKFNPTDIASAIGVEQLKKLDWMNERRKMISEYYDTHLQGLDITCPHLDPKTKSSYHLYPIRLGKCNRDDFIKRMAQKGIATSVHFIPLHLMPFYQRKYGYRRGDFPVAERVFENIVSLPIYPQLTQKQLEYIVRSAKEILSHRDVKQ